MYVHFTFCFSLQYRVAYSLKNYLNFETQIRQFECPYQKNEFKIKKLTVKKKKKRVKKETLPVFRRELQYLH